ncbi:MAG: aspartate-semialdehyde dehydrogenase [Chloroflexi bacterium]|nr:aspartate-semialdehyde dehydrogenase [Chloroflexota bacterium]
MQKIPVAILGATGAVGQRFISLLEGHPWFEVAEVVASERSAGSTYKEATNWVLDGYPPTDVTNLIVQTLEDDLTSPVVFSALPSSQAKEAEFALAQRGHVVCTNASAYRMTKDVPILLPEINAAHIELVDIQRKNYGWTTGALVTNSNCTSTPVAMSLAPLRQFRPTHVQVVSMQAVSGAGYPGVPSLDIMDNVIPFIGGEEDKLTKEPAKMLGTFNGDSVTPFDMIVSAACNRVPVLDSHLVNVAVRFAEEVTVDDLLAAWENFRGPDDVANLPSAPERPVEVAYAQDRPQPRRDRMAGNGMSAVVGRVRECHAVDGFQYLALSHNTIRGAAGCSILNAEYLVAKGYVQQQTLPNAQTIRS